MSSPSPLSITERSYRYLLFTTPGLGGRLGRVLIAQFGSATEICSLPEEVLSRYIKPKTLNALLTRKAQWDVDFEYKVLHEKQIQLVFWDEPDYPQKLLEIPDYPTALYYRGTLPDSQKPAVAIIGARSCSEYGALIARELGQKLALAGVQIISGMALGIDGISQKAALQAGGNSFGILGCGVDICYPKSNYELYNHLPSRGGLISEYPPGTQPKPNLFPPRNRIISSLSDLVIVVEAKEKSGTLITVDMALEQGREVYAVPGRITDALSAGCHKLIRQGAGIADSAETILDALLYEETAQSLQLSAACKASAKEALPGSQSTSASIVPRGLSGEELELWSCLDIDPRSVEEIYERYLQLTCIKETGNSPASHKTIQEIMTSLISLTLKSAAKQVAGGRFCKRMP